MILKKGSILKLDTISRNMIPIFTYDDAKRYLGKGWNYINIYNLLLLKQSYIALCSLADGSGEKREFYEKFNFISGKSLKNRAADEFLNALKCLNVIGNGKKLQIINKIEFNLEKPQELDNTDKRELSKFYFSYIRFKYFHNWFLGNISNMNNMYSVEKEEIIKDSIPIFSLSDKIYFDNPKNEIKPKKRRHLFDTFFYPIFKEYHQFDSQIMGESDEEKALMRFWDVYIEWGRNLNLIEKINVSNAVGIYGHINENKNIYLYYFINDTIEIDLTKFINEYYPKSQSSISLPELTINLAINYRCSVKKIHAEILKQSTNSNYKFSLQRTSAIFITGKEFIYPKIGNTFVSHLFIR